MQAETFFFFIVCLQSCCFSVNHAGNNIAVSQISTRIAHLTNENSIAVMYIFSNHAIAANFEEKVFPRLIGMKF